MLGRQAPLGAVSDERGLWPLSISDLGHPTAAAGATDANANEDTTSNGDLPSVNVNRTIQDVLEELRRIRRLMDQEERKLDRFANSCLSPVGRLGQPQ
jgi:hypothetical protein